MLFLGYIGGFTQVSNIFCEKLTHNINPRVLKCNPFVDIMTANLVEMHIAKARERLDENKKKSKFLGVAQGAAIMAIAFGGEPDAVISEYKYENRNDLKLFGGDIYKGVQINIKTSVFSELVTDETFLNYDPKLSKVKTTTYFGHSSSKNCLDHNDDVVKTSKINMPTILHIDSEELEALLINFELFNGDVFRNDYSKKVVHKIISDFV